MGDMWKFIKTLLKLVGVVVVAGIAVTGYMLYRGGAFKTLEPHFDGECASLELDGSAEDIVIDRGRGFAYLSLRDRFAPAGSEAAQGTVARIDLNRRPLSAEPALESQPAHFFIHGLTLHVDEAGGRHLLAINHPVNREQEAEMVERFEETAPGVFRHVETFTSPLMNSPNDLVAVGPRTFYVANDAVAGGGWRAGAQQFGAGYSTLVYMDGNEGTIATGDIASGGGVNASADGALLYVAETSGQRIRVLARDPADGSVTELDRVAIGTSPDNIDVAADGSLWIGAHANTLKLIRHFINQSPAPSQVLRMAWQGPGQADTEEIFLDSGERISAGSVGATYGGRLLIGSITARQVLVCDMQR